MLIQQLNEQIINCRNCPRLVEWREKSAQQKTRRFHEWEYWGKPVPGFGDVDGQLWIIGLAPAAHGGNRTGRIFTGDRSGDWLFRALYRAGFASQAESYDRKDGMKLRNCYVSAIVRCAPPGNKPTQEEIRNCRPYLMREMKILKKKHIILCLGQLSFRNTVSLLEEVGLGVFRPKPKFSHGKIVNVNDNIEIIMSYHPSQQNTFTGVLTEKMFDDVFEDIVERLKTNSE